MRKLSSLLTLSLLLASISPARAEWFYDFNNRVIPDTFIVEGRLDSGELSPTFDKSAAGGFLYMYDLVSPRNSGAIGGSGYDPEVFSGNVRVSAEINTAGTTNDWLGVFARSTAPFGGNYFAALCFYPNDPNFGRIMLGKALPDGDNEFTFSAGRVTDLQRSYFMEMEVIDDPVTITTRLFEEEGGPQVLEASFRDWGHDDVPPYTSGRAGVWAWSGGGTALDATFDNIRAVPEPSTLLLLSIGTTGLLVLAFKRRSRAA